MAEKVGWIGWVGIEMGVGGGGVTEAAGWKGWAGTGTTAGDGWGDEWLRMWNG